MRILFLSNYGSFAYSALACFSIEASGSAFFQMAKKLLVVDSRFGGVGGERVGAG